MAMRAQVYVWMDVVTISQHPLTAAAGAGVGLPPLDLQMVRDCIQAAPNGEPLLGS